MAGYISNDNVDAICIGIVDEGALETAFVPLMIYYFRLPFCLLR